VDKSCIVAATGNHSFVERLATEYGQRLRRFFSVRVRQIHDIPDLAQEVYLRLLRVDRHELIRNPENYLFTVASHVASQHTLRHATRPPSVDIAELPELAADDGDDPAGQADNAQQLAKLDAWLKQLPPRVAATLVLHRLGGYTVQEIADQLGVSRETAKKYLARAIEHCRNQSLASVTDRS
jgi:RNA polymerase sigma-70 factor (ECF subfamily)